MHKPLMAEFIGTFVLVFGGCGSAVLAAAVPDVGIGWLGVSLAFGLTVMCMAYAVGPISGGHFNPAVTLGLKLAGRFDGSVAGDAGDPPEAVLAAPGFGTTTRLRLVSTTTFLVRPWLKLCFTWPGPRPRRPSVFLPSVSLIWSSLPFR